MRSIYAAGVPPVLRVAAAAQALEAVGLCVAAVAQVAETLNGQSYRASSGLALAAMELITVALIGSIASGIARLRPWSRTPAIMTQLGCGLLAIILLQAHRLDWGLPTLVLAIVGLAGLFHPASLKALARPRRDSAPATAATAVKAPIAPKGPAAPGKRVTPTGTATPRGKAAAASATPRKKKSAAR